MIFEVRKMKKRETKKPFEFSMWYIWCSKNEKYTYVIEKWMRIFRYKLKRNDISKERWKSRICSNCSFRNYYGYEVKPKERFICGMKWKCELLRHNLDHSLFRKYFESFEKKNKKKKKASQNVSQPELKIFPPSISFCKKKKMGIQVMDGSFCLQ